MNPKKTGAFILQLRKEKRMTQKQLAQKLNITDKAVSRWECGKGYPDIEMLAMLGEEFSVSISELLCGERTTVHAQPRQAEKQVAGAYINVAVKKKWLSTVAIVLVISLVVVMLFSTVAVGGAVALTYNTLKGSSDCVIASDYSYLTLYDERYVPLIMCNSYCRSDTLLIDEAQVQNMPVIIKLFFGDRVYTVKGCENNDIVYLQTDQDGLQTPYYCKESKLATYMAVAKNTPYDRLTAEIITEDWSYVYLMLSDELTQMLISGKKELSPTENAEWSRGRGDECINIILFQNEGPFCRDKGELLRKNGEYYWHAYDDFASHSYTNPTLPDKVYILDDAYDVELDRLFMYMFQ